MYSIYKEKRSIHTLLVFILMATENMHRCLVRTNNDSQKLSIRRKFKENNSLRTSLEDRELASVPGGNFNRRSAFLTFLCLGPDGSVRIVSLPLRYPDCTNPSGSGAKENVESLRLLYIKPPDPLKFIRAKVQQGSQLAGSYFGNTYMDTTFAPSRESYQKPVTCISGSFDRIETGLNSNSIPDTVSGSEIVDNVKRKSRKKSRKKGKKGKKLSGASSYTEPHMLSVECADGSSASDTCGNREALLPETGIENESPKPCISHYDELEVDIPSAGNLGHQGILQFSEFPIEDGVGSIPPMEMNHRNDLHSRGCFDMHDFFVKDSLSVVPNSNNHNTDGHDEKHAEEEIHRLHELSCFSSRMRYMSSQSLLNDVIDTHDSNERMRHGLQKSAVPTKRSKQYTLDKTSANFLKLGSTENLCIPKGNEKNHSVQQKVLKNGENDCNWELEKESSVYPQNDPTLVDSALPNRSGAGFQIKASPKRGENMQQKDKVFKELKSEDGLAPKQVHCAQNGARANIPGSDRRDMSDILSQIKDNRGSRLVSGSCSQPSSPTVLFQRNKEGCGTSESVQSWTPTNTAKGVNQDISSGAGIVCVGQSPGDVACYFDKDLNAVEAESDRILEAVHNACRAQLTSEALQTLTGDPIAEFERLLYHSSPVVHESPHLVRCQTCSRTQVPGLPICRHETTNISLGCLWKWYQRSGSYGLEIRAEDFGNSRRLGADHGTFHAYFVPYLSGIQLFQSGRSDAACTTEVLGEKPENLSNFSHLPINPILFPRPGKENAIAGAPVNKLCISQQSSAPANDSIQITSTMGPSDLELLFEYFESERPQQRQPLYDKIKELIEGDRPDSNVYGDPTYLETINLNDLHPKSWFSVAWYPIYRIPHGNLRVAFLTYHSLGHLILRSANFESPSVDAHVVSPVVGLRAYNAQDECWFQPRHLRPRQNSATLGPGVNSVDGVLEERLRTLEETASLMARAVVKKGGMISVNRHPDYEFFLSRCS